MSVTLSSSDSELELELWLLEEWELLDECELEL